MTQPHAIPPEQIELVSTIARLLRDDGFYHLFTQLAGFVNREGSDLATDTFIQFALQARDFQPLQRERRQ